MNFNPPPPQDVIQAGVSAVQELTGAGHDAAEDAGTAAQQAANSEGQSKLDALRRINQSTEAVLAEMADILSEDFSSSLQKKRKVLEWLKQTKQGALKEVMAAEKELMGMEFMLIGQTNEFLVELLEEPWVLQVVMTVICVIAVVVAVIVAATSQVFTAVVIICVVAMVAAAVVMLAVTISMNITALLKGAKVVGKAALDAGNAGAASWWNTNVASKEWFLIMGSVDAATQAAVIKAAGQTKGMLSVFQAEALTNQAQIQRTVESIVTALSNALVGADAATSAALERVRHDMKRAIGPAVEKVVGAKEQAGQVLQRAYWELLQAIRNLLMHRHY